MNTDDVWALVDQARGDLDADTRRVNADDIAERMAQLLAQREVADIVAFQQPLWDLLAQSYRLDLWAAAYLINGGASDDGFEYFRGWLIAQGRAVYEQALADPDTLAEVPAVVDPEDDWQGVECEDMLSVAWDAHQAATGEQLPADSWSVTYPQLDAESDFDFDDEDEMRRRLPRLAALCYDRADTDADDFDDADESDDSEDASDEADLDDDDLDEDLDEDLDDELDDDLEEFVLDASPDAPGDVLDIDADGEVRRGDRGLDG